MGKSRITLILTLNSQPFVFCLCCMPPIPTNRIKIPRNPVFHFTIRQNQKRKVGRFLRLRRDHSIHISGLVQPIYIQNSEVPPTAPLTHTRTHTHSQQLGGMLGDGWRRPYLASYRRGWRDEPRQILTSLPVCYSAPKHQLHVKINHERRCDESNRAWNPGLGMQGPANSRVSFLLES